MTETPESLIRRINLGEDTTLELKEVILHGDRVKAPHRDSLANEIAAMANTTSGSFVLGVDSNREVVGIPLDKLEVVERWLYEICEDSIEPAVSFQTFRMELPDSLGTLHPILLVKIPRSLFVHLSPGGYFRRQGSSKRPIPPDVLARLFQQRSQARLIRFDEQTVPNTSFEDLSEELWRRFAGESRDDPKTVLRKLSLLREDDSGVESATVSGVLLCTDQPEKFLRSAVITAVHYRGKRRDSNYQLDAQEISGPLDQQVYKALSFVRRNMSVSAVKSPGRIELPQYDDRAVFEAIVNAVAHRDYSIAGSKIRIFMFDDRLEIYSPGALPNTLTIGSIALRQSTRNELIASLLAKCPAPGGTRRSFIMDKRGDGVPIIKQESLTLSGIEPTYQLIDDSELLLTIWAANPTDAKDAADPTG